MALGVAVRVKLGLKLGVGVSVKLGVREGVGVPEALALEVGDTLGEAVPLPVRELVQVPLGVPLPVPLPLPVAVPEKEGVAGGVAGGVAEGEPLLVADCVAAMRAAVPIPVTVKCRIGVDDQDRLGRHAPALGPDRVEDGGGRRPGDHVVPWPPEVGDANRLDPQEATLREAPRGHPGRDLGVPLAPLNGRAGTDEIVYELVQVAIDREGRTATIRLKGPTAPPPATAGPNLRS